VSNVGGGLPWLLAHEQGLRVDATEGIDDDLTLYTLNGIHHHGNATLVDGLETLCTSKWAEVSKQARELLTHRGEGS
jgi:hypothetical protein